MDATLLKRETCRDMTKTHKFDIAIVGGGLAGGLAAAALSDAGFSCALIDIQPLATKTEASFDGRTTAISYACARVFKRLGLWDAIAPEAEPIRDILVTDGRPSGRFSKGDVSPLKLHFDSRELGTDEPLGWIAENQRLRSVINDHILNADGIEIFAPARWRDVDFGAGAARLTLDNGDTINADLIVGADGRFSMLRAEANIKLNKWRYKQAGIVVTVAHKKPHKGVAQELFLPSGPFAILPMTQNRSSLVWTEREDLAPEFLKLNDDAFTREIENRFGPYLGAISLASPRWSYPLAFHLAQSYIAPRLALIGDAAHAIHPIAGQGFNLGIKDIAALTDVLVEARSVGLDIGAMTAIEGYQRWRRYDSTTLALGTDVLNRLFSNDIGPLRIARDIGMDAVGRVAPLRKMFMRQAGADLGKLPKLMAAES